MSDIYDTIKFNDKLFNEDFKTLISEDISEEKIRYLMMKLNYSREDAELIVKEKRYEEVIEEGDA